MIQGIEGTPAAIIKVAIKSGDRRSAFPIVPLGYYWMGL